MAEPALEKSSGDKRERRGLMRAMGKLLERRIERVALIAVALTATLASFAEAMILVVISLGGLRLSQDVAAPVNLPLGLPLDELETRLLVVAGLILLVLRLGVLLFNAYIAARLSEVVLYRWRRRLFQAYQNTAWEVQSNVDEGYLQTLTQTYVNRVAMTLQQLTRAITAGTSFTTFVLGAILISPIAALGLAGFGAALYAALRPFTRTIRRYAEGQKTASREYARLLAEASSLSLEHRVFGVEDTIERQVDGQQRLMVKLRTRQLTLQSFTPNLYVGIGYAVILVGLIVANRMEIAEVASLGAIVLLMIRSLGYGQTFQNTSQSLASAEPFIFDMFEGIQQFESRATDFGDVDPGAFRSLRFEHTTLQRGDATVLPDVDLTIRAGEAIGIIGPSGGGKSTLALALLRLIEPTSGQLTINDTPSAQCSSNWWRRNIAFVPQDPHLFDGSVLQNIAFHRDEVSRSEVTTSAMNAHLAQELDSWDLGIDHPIGVSGGRLSGGQRQRLCIARALAGDPAVLIFDEPTSALDRAAEESITSVLADLAGTRTLIVIAHRISTLQFCDRIISIEGGRLTELGSGQDLVDQSGS